MKRYPFIWKRRNINNKWDISVFLSTHFQLGFPDISILRVLPLSGQLILSTPEVNKFWNLWLVACKIHYKFLRRWFSFPILYSSVTAHPLLFVTQQYVFFCFLSCNRVVLHWYANMFSNRTTHSSTEVWRLSL